MTQELENERKLYAFAFNYTETVKGTGYAKTEEEVREGLVREFGMAPDFRIMEVTVTDEVMMEKQLSLELVEPPSNSMN